MPSSSVADIERALAAASYLHEAGSWSQLTPEARCDVLAGVHAKLAAVGEEMAAADASETGVPISVTRMIAGSLKEAFASDALHATCRDLGISELRTAHGPLRHVHKAFGPALIIAPWNVPSGTVAPKLIAALVAGCPVIVKPSEWAPTGLEIFLKAVCAAGLPPGALQWVHGGPEVGAALVSDARVGAVHFTGTLEAGRQVAVRCAERLVPVMMECGGSNAAIVLEDADLDKTASAVASGITMLNGQWCAGISRLIVHEKRAADLVQRILSRFGETKLGPSDDDTTEVGPLAHRAHLQKIERICAELVQRGGRVRRAPTAGPLPAGNFFAPTLIEGVPGVPDAGEIFGPLATVHTFSDPAEAVHAANLRPLLQCYVFGADVERALNVGSGLRCGSVMVNGVGFGWEGPVLTADGAAPAADEPPAAFFGGAGLGTEGGIAGFLGLFAGPQNIGVSG